MKKTDNFLCLKANKPNIWNQTNQQNIMFENWAYQTLYTFKYRKHKTQETEHAEAFLRPISNTETIFYDLKTKKWTLNNSDVWPWICRIKETKNTDKYLRRRPPYPQLCSETKYTEQTEPTDDLLRAEVLLRK